MGLAQVAWARVPGSAAARKGVEQEPCFPSVQGCQLHARPRCKRSKEAMCIVGEHRAPLVVEPQAAFVGLGQLERLVTNATASVGGKVEKVMDGLQRLDQQGCVPSVGDYYCLLETCAQNRALEDAKRVQAHIVKNGLEDNSMLGNCLVQTFVKCGSLQDALQVFSRLSKRAASSWTAVISGYCQVKQGRKALTIYKEMQAEGLKPNKHTFVYALKACASLADLASSRQIHEELAKQRYGSDLIVATTLVVTYTRCGSMEDAQVVFERMPQRDAVAWSTMIAGYIQQDQAEEAFDLYRQMQDEGVRPNDRTFLSLLKGCSILAGAEEETRVNGLAIKPNALQQGKIIHEHFVEARSMASEFIRSSLIQMYATCGSVEDARLAFDMLPTEDVVLWNAMIAAYSQQQNAEKAVELYLQMTEASVSPDERTFVSVLKACGSLAAMETDTCIDRQALKLGTLEKGKSIHADVVRHGYQSDVFVNNTLVHVYANCGSIKDARDVFDTLSQRNVVSWNVMIAGYAQQDQGEEALHLFDRMREKGLKPNDRTFVSVLKALSSLCSGNESTSAGEYSLDVRVFNAGQRIHSDIVRGGYQSDQFVGNSLVHMYASCGGIDHARHVFDTLSQRGIVSWNAMLAGYSQHNDSEKALQLFDQMQQERVQPNERTFVSILKACATLAAKERESALMGGQELSTTALEHIKLVHAEICTTVYSSDVFVGSSLLHAYAACGKIEDAREIFDALPHYDTVVWNTMLGGYAQQDGCDEAFQLYVQMKQEGIKPDEATFLNLLKVCSNSGALTLCTQMHREIAESGSDWSDDLLSSLIHAYGKSGSMLDARQVFDSAAHHSVVLWSSLIAGYARAGDCESCFCCFGQMQQAGAKPDGITFTSLLSACGHSGLVDKGLSYFNSMTTEFGISATMEHYITVVDLCARAGYFHKAEELVLRMPMEPDLRLWLTLLSACRTHVHVKLGRVAFERAVCLDPAHCAAYGMMSNIYVSAQMLDKAREIEELRAHACAGKKPGQSWILFNNTVHKFRVAEDMNEQTHEVYARLKEFTTQAKTTSRVNG